ncbi:hypothetical protein K8A14_15340, partial [Listeria monocytogenes]|nr:hypothetical protein [Listeria monocytogenes]MCB2484265.1 hypothetical protein [Listeria monocytogenes]MCD1874097.1 hypothetical protein [Listeria monocytogenes]
TQIYLFIIYERRDILLIEGGEFHPSGYLSLFLSFLRNVISATARVIISRTVFIDYEKQIVQLQRFDERIFDINIEDIVFCEVMI